LSSSESRFAVEIGNGDKAQGAKFALKQCRQQIALTHEAVSGIAGFVGFGKVRAQQSVAGAVEFNLPIRTGFEGAEEAVLAVAEGLVGHEIGVREGWDF